MSDIDTKSSDAEMLEKLAAAGEKVEKQKKERQARAVKGSHLTEQLLAIAQTAGLTIEEQTGFYKFTAGVKGKNMYLARKGGLVDLSGYTVDLPIVEQFTEEQAQEKHIGRVRGRIDRGFEQTGTPEGDAAVVEAFKAAVAGLMEPLPPVAAKEKKAPRAKKVVSPVDTETTDLLTVEQENDAEARVS